MSIIFVLDEASMYVLNTRTLSALTVISLMLLFLVFLFSLMYICKHVDGLC